jgi:hypothetical protein
MNMPDDQNPYAAPGSSPGLPTAPRQGQPDLAFMARWERRRLVYNGVLILESCLLALALGGFRWFAEVDFWELAIGGALVANLCFCAGPVGESYLRWIGLRGGWVGPFVFGLGLCIAGGLAFVSMLAYPFLNGQF